MTKERIILITAILFTLIWVLEIPYLFPHPFQQNEGLKKLSEEVIKASDIIKEATGINGLSAAEIENNLSRELKITWVVSIVLIGCGCISGFLLFRKKNYGRLLAIGVSLIVVSKRLINLFSSEYWRERLSLKAYALQFEYFPIRTIQDDVTFIVLLATIVLLLQPSIAKIFKHSQANTADS